MTETKKALVIGGGIAGISAITGLRNLDKDVEITLVEPKDHLELFWATFRSPFEKWVAEGSLKPLDVYCEEKNVKHVRALVTKLTETEATLNNGEVIPFDVCTVAIGAGSHWGMLGRGPRENLSRDDRLKELEAAGEDILNAGSLLIVGGGLIGCEVAGDVAAYAKKAGKDLNVTLVHSGAALCDATFSDGASKMLQKKLEKLGVTIILNEKAKKKDGSDSTFQLTNSGKEIEANMHIMTIGFKPLNSFLEEMEGALDDNGWIQTDENFRIKGSKANGKLFAIGDCTPNLPNAGNLYMRNHGIIGNNLKATLDGDTEGKLKEIDHGFEATVQTCGPDTGIFYNKYFYTQYLVPWLKNATMFFSSAKHTVGI